MRGGNSTGAKADLEGTHIADKNDQGNFTSQSEVGNVVGKALLGER